MLRESRAIYFNSLCNNPRLNPKRFWSLFKLKSKSSNIPETVSIKTSGNLRQYANNTNDITNLFNKYFTSIFTSDVDTECSSQPKSVPQASAVLLEDIELDEQNVERV